jgi:K+-sensing histidine kinase KdpD
LTATPTLPELDEHVRVDLILQAQRGRVIAASILVPALACWLLSLLRGSVPSTTAAIALVLPVVAAAATGIRVAGITAALVAAAGFDYFLTEPFHQFRIADPTDLETAVLLLLVGTAVSELAVWGHRQLSRASREQGYLDGLLDTAGAVAAGSATASEVINLVADQITTVLRIDACRFDPTPDFGGPELTADGTVTRNGRTLNILRHGLPTDATIALKVRNGGSVYGHYLLTAATRVSRPSPSQLQFAVLLADQIGAALATHHIAVTNSQTAVSSSQTAQSGSVGAERPRVLSG